MSTIIRKDERNQITAGLMVATARFSEALVLRAPDSRGMVLCRVYLRDGSEADMSFPVQTLRWM